MSKLQVLPCDLLVSNIFNVQNLSACSINNMIKSQDLNLNEDDYFHLIKTHFDEDFLLDFDTTLGNSLQERFQILSESHCVKLVFKFYLYNPNNDTEIKEGKIFKQKLPSILKWYQQNWDIFRSDEEIYAMHHYANSENTHT